MILSTSFRPSFFKTTSLNHPIELEDVKEEIHENNKVEVTWCPELDQLLRKWKVQVRARQNQHKKLSTRYAIIHYAIGLPFTILQAMVATGNFFQAFNTDSSTGCNNSSQWVLLTMGILGAISTILSALFMFMNNQAKSEEHSTASSNYEKLHRYIESVLSMPVNIRGDPIEIIKDIRSVYDEVATNSPMLSEDPIPGGILYSPLVAKPPVPDDFTLKNEVERQHVIHMPTRTHIETSNEEDLDNLERLTTHPQIEGDVFLPFDIEHAIYDHNKI